MPDPNRKLKPAEKQELKQQKFLFPQAHDEIKRAANECRFVSDHYWPYLGGQAVNTYYALQRRNSQLVNGTTTVQLLARDIGASPEQVGYSIEVLLGANLIKVILHPAEPDHTGIEWDVIIPSPESAWNRAR